MTSNGTILELREIRKTFGNIEALKGINLSVQAGEFFGFLGPNGAGKSTLMKILSGFLEADQGEVRIKGEPVQFNQHKSRRTCGLVPQEVALYESLSPAENLKIFARLYELPERFAESRGEHLLNAVGLWERRRDRVKDFSGGMKRRLNLVLSLLHDPDVLFCDEPTVGVDPQSRNAIFTFLEASNREGLTILYTTHYMEEAERLCPRIAIIDHGEILACGEQSALLNAAGCRQEIIIRKGGGHVPALDSVKSHAEILEEDQLIRLLPRAGTPLSRMFTLLETSGVPSERLVLRPPSLESLFLQLTGHRLRD